MNIAFVSYETHFAPCGGIAAVMARLPARVQSVSHVETIVITPFHHRIEKMAALGRSHEGSFGVPVADRNVVVHVYRHDDKVPYYFLLPEDTRYFAGQRHPYDVGGDDLLRDALFFGAAIPRSLHVIDPGKRWTLLLQDWEAATAVLATADSPGRPRGFVTLHNSYDSTVSGDQLWSAGINPDGCPGGTILQRALPLTELPVFTVSEQFAHDLTEDPLQMQVMAPQLQLTLKPRLVGIDNGPFVDLAIEQKMLAEAQAGNYAALAKWKADHRQTFLTALKKLKPGNDKPLWGDVTRFDGGDAPWFVMAGRDDPRQKGYDVLTRAAEMFLEAKSPEDKISGARPAARFLFFPIPGDEGLAGLGFLRKLAERFPESVLVFPFLFREAFTGALRGATYGVMPSLYEPFGMANEFYLNGTVGIGRATGGIVQQIVPLRTAASFSPQVDHRAARWHEASAPATGFLYREQDGLPSEIYDWRTINAANYDCSGAGPDRLHERIQYPLFQSMAAELTHTLEDATSVARDQPQVYYQLLTAGIAHIGKEFSWNRSALDYVRHAVQ